MMMKFESGGDVFFPFAPSPGPGGDGEGSARSHFDEGRAGLTARVEPAIGAVIPGADGREGAGVYPVAGRTTESNHRIAGHEIGHAFLARALGSIVHFVTIIPHGDFAGRCVRSGPPSSLGLLDESPVSTDEVVDVLDVCARLERLTPEIGSSRIIDADGLVRAQVACVELVAGRVAEQVLFPDLPPLNASHDCVEAAAFARVAVVAQAAAADLIRYAEAEAAALIRENLDIVLALVAAILERGILSGDEVDAIIAQAVAARAAESERQRRAEWRRAEQSAKAFDAFRAPFRRHGAAPSAALEPRSKGPPSFDTLDPHLPHKRGSRGLGRPRRIASEVGKRTSA